MSASLGSSSEANDALQLVLLELLLYFSAIAIFGHSRLIERGLPLLVGVEVVLHALDGLVDLGAFNRDALSSMASFTSSR